MGNLHKKKEKVFIDKGTIEDSNGRKFNIDFVGDNDDFVNISYDDPKKLEKNPIKDLLKKNSGSVFDICFIKNYNYLLVGCKDGYLHSYKRIINNKSNLKFEEIKIFKPHESNIIQILELQSGHILTLSSDASAKILEIELNPDSNSDKNNFCNEVQTLLKEIPENNSNNSAIELSSGNLIVSQGFFINFFEKKIDDIIVEGGATKVSRTISIFNTSEKEYHLTKKIFTNSDCISFIEIDNRIFGATQIINKTLQLYDINDYSLIKNITNIELTNLRNNMCLINKEILAIGGNNGSLYLINLKLKQILCATHITNCSCISCIKIIDNTRIVMGCQFRNSNNDVVTFKLGENYELNEIDRVEKVHNGVVKDIKLVDKKISNNDNSFNELYNLISIGSDLIAKLILREEKKSS